MHEERTDWDLSLDEQDPEMIWILHAQSADPVIFQYGGETALVLEPDAPVDGLDDGGRPVTNLQFRWRPFIPGDTAWLLLFAVDVNFNVTPAISMELEPTEAGVVEVLAPFPHNAWVLSEEEEELYLVMLVISEDAFADDEDGYLDSIRDALEYAWGVEELVDTLNWALLHPDIDTLIYRFSVEEADAVLHQLGWTR